MSRDINLVVPSPRECRESVMHSLRNKPAQDEHWNSSKAISRSTTCTSQHVLQVIPDTPLIRRFRASF
jgi:hypothetical protein